MVVGSWRSWNCAPFSLPVRPAGSWHIKPWAQLCLRGKFHCCVLQLLFWVADKAKHQGIVCLKCVCVLRSEQDGNYRLMRQSDHHSGEYLASVVLVFWLSDEQGHFFFFFLFMYLKFWLLANLGIQSTPRILLCFIVLYFIFCPARIISYRKENTVKQTFLERSFHYFLFFPLHRLPTTGSALGFSIRKRKEKIKRQNNFHKVEAAPHAWNIFCFHW